MLDFFLYSYASELKKKNIYKEFTNFEPVFGSDQQTFNSFF